MLFNPYTKHLLQAMNGKSGIFKKAREVKIILRDRAYSSMPLEWRARPAARNHINEEQFNDFHFISP